MKNLCSLDTWRDEAFTLVFTSLRRLRRRVSLSFETERANVNAEDTYNVH